jgi:putative tributyrin esterase
MLTRAAAGSDLAHDSAVLGRRKVARVLAPAERRRDAPVLFMLHPFAGNRRSWLDHAPELIAGLARETLVVLPECGRRWFIDDHSGAHYETYLVEELLPLVRSELGTDGPAAVAGFSAGGAAAFFLTLRHPDRFAAALAVAGAFTAADRTGDPYAAVRSDDLMIPTEAEHDRVWGPPGSATRAAYDPAALVAAMAERPERPVFVLEVGTEDFPRMIEASQRMKALLDAAGLAARYWQAPGAHSWTYAAAGMARLLAQWREMMR